MRKFMANMAFAKELLWEFVELGFVSILAIMLIYLILGQGSGGFVLSVADNVTKFASSVPTPSLVGPGAGSGRHLPADEPAHVARGKRRVSARCMQVAGDAALA